jgi:hypothetical protein
VQIRRSFDLFECLPKKQIRVKVIFVVVVGLNESPAYFVSQSSSLYFCLLLEAFFSGAFDELLLLLLLVSLTDAFLFEFRNFCKNSCCFD